MYHGGFAVDNFFNPLTYNPLTSSSSVRVKLRFAIPLRKLKPTGEVKLVKREYVQLTRAALDEVEGGRIILRGVLDPESLRLLQVAEYQREVLPITKIEKLVEAFKIGSVPDVDLGMRGGDYNDREGIFTLKNDVFIIDGLQRVNAGLLMLQKSDGVPRLGATIHFDTTEEWERERFKILNVDRTKLSPNVLIRNMRADTPVIDLLYNLSTGSEKGFVLTERVCWAQRQQAAHIVTALTFAKTVAFLHAHIGPGRSTGVLEVARGLQQICDTTGKVVFRDNVRAFFNLIDECWGIRRVQFRAGAVYMRTTFLICLATLFSRHEIFWKGNHLVVSADLKRKISKFPVMDPTIANLASASGKATDMLYTLMIQHVNSGKRQKRLVPRDNVPKVGPELVESVEQGVEETATEIEARAAN